MIIARFEFNPEYAFQFIEKGCFGQNIIELAFEDVPSLIIASQEFEAVLLNCTAMIEGKVIDLRALSST